MGFEEVVVDLLRLAATELPADVGLALKNAMKNEESPAAKKPKGLSTRKFPIATEEVVGDDGEVLLPERLFRTRLVEQSHLKSHLL
jgi:hypothetical protein